ncbi:MAG: hypothetical protein ACRC18_06975 [Cetobacterium sp.]
MTTDDILKLIGGNPGKLKRIKTTQEGDNVITIYEINGIQFAVKI